MLAKYQVLVQMATKMILKKKRCSAYVIELLDEYKCHNNGYRIKCIPQYIVKALVLFHLCLCKIQKNAWN